MLTIARYYTMLEAAHKLGMAASAVKKFLVRRGVEVVRVSGLLAVEKPDIDRMAENKRRFGKYG